MAKKLHEPQDDGKRVLLLYRNDGDTLEILGKKSRDGGFLPYGSTQAIPPSVIPTEYKREGYDHAQVVKLKDVQSALKAIWEETHAGQKPTHH